jgi:hypothetical protein
LGLIVAAPEAFDKILKRARLAEAAHADALANVRDARDLRLQALRNAVLPRLSGHSDALQYVELAVQPGETPRLWIDLITSVVVAPDTRNFQLQQEQDGGRATLYETDDLDDMADQVLRIIAHRAIAKKRAIAAMPIGKASVDSGFSLPALIYVWFTGVALGVLSLLVAAIALNILKF